jgi:hypothetical protein
MKLSVLVIMVFLSPKCLAQEPLSAAPALRPAEHSLLGKTKTVMEAEKSKDQSRVRWEFQKRCGREAVAALGPLSCVLLEPSVAQLTLNPVR